MVDRGVRKFRMAAIAIGALTLGYGATAIWSALTPTYPAYAGAVIAVVSAFFGANVWEKRGKSDSGPSAPS